MKLFISLLVGVCMHSLIAMYVDKLRFLKRKPMTNWGLIPFANMYLLGTYAIDVIVGILLFVLLFFAVDFSITLFGVKYGFSILTDTARQILFFIYFIGTICLLVYSASKYNKFTNNKDRFYLDDIIYYLKETLWIVIFCIVLYLFIMFVVGVGTGVIII